MHGESTGVPGHAEPFSCSVEARPDGVLVRPFGELDLWTVPTVERLLFDSRQAGLGSIELDLGSLSFLDSSAIALVIRWSRASAEAGFMLHVRAGTAQVRRLFAMTALTHLLIDAVPPEQVV